MSCSASGARISSAAIAAADPAFHFFPRESGSRILQEIRLSPRQLLLLPVVDRYSIGRGGELIPQILHELELLRGAQIKDRWRRCAHADSFVNCLKMLNADR